jgi:hypothetical protein
LFCKMKSPPRGFANSSEGIERKRNVLYRN